MDFAARAHNHNYRMDPIVRSREDTDFYKLTMGQVIHEKHPMTQVAFELTNRTADVRLADFIELAEVKEQLDHVQTLRWTKSELINVKGQTYYGVEGMFKPAMVNALAHSKLPDYEISVDRDAGQFVFRSEGAWFDVKDWEIHVLSVVNELRNRAVMRAMPKSALDIMYARAKVKLYAKLERLKQFPELSVSDFGSRRRHSFLWQEWAVLTACEVLGKQFVGSSNVHIAHKHGLEAIGTNAHEMPMVYAALAAGISDDALRNSQYQVLQDWMSVYGENLRIFLPDTFGTAQFLAGAPAWLQWWKGYRPDSKEPFEAGEEAIVFWKRLATDPTQKMCLFADGLDVEIPGFKPLGTDMIEIHKHFYGRIKDTYGWGTSFTNDFIGCPVGDPMAMKPLSLVCKVASVNGRAAVKISDNPAKARSPDPAELAHYLRVFGHEGHAEREVLV